MRLENSFEVPAPIERAWEVLLDIERVAPCMPGATLTSHSGDDFTGTVKVKLGPVNLTYKGKGRFVTVDEAARTVVITASGADARGAGTAAATVTATLVASAESRTRVEVATDLEITGKAVQFGRGMIGDVSARLVGQFADCLAGKVASSADPSPTPGDAPATADPAPATADPAPATATGPAPASLDGAAATSPGATARAPAAASPGGTTAPAPATPPSPTPSVSAGAGESPWEAEPIDLLAVTDAGAMARRALPYVATAVAGLLLLVVVRRVRRRRRS